MKYPVIVFGLALLALLCAGCAAAATARPAETALPTLPPATATPPAAGRHPPANHLEQRLQPDGRASRAAGGAAPAGPALVHGGQLA